MNEGWHTMARRGWSGLAAAALAATVLLGVVPPSSSAEVTHVPTTKHVTMLQGPKPWVGVRDVHENRTVNTDVVEGVLAVDGRFALVVHDEELPRLAPTEAEFTISMCVFLLHEPVHEHHAGLFWKGHGNDHRTPSAWLLPRTNRVTFRVSTAASNEVWGASNAHLPVRRWSHITFSLSSRDRIMRFYVDGQLDAAVESPSPAVANVGPLYVGKDLSGEGVRAFITSVQMHPFALDDEDVQQAAAVALRDAPDFDGEAERDAELGREADAVVERRVADAFEANLAAFEPPNRNRDPDRDPRVNDGTGERARAGRHGDPADDSDDADVSADDSADDSAPSSSLSRLAGKDAETVAPDPRVEIREAYAAEHFRAGEDARAHALSLTERDPANLRAAFDGVSYARASYARAASAGNNAARTALATAYDWGYGDATGASRPARAAYHRLRAAAAGDPEAQLALGAAAHAGMSRASSPRAACALALYYLYHSATTAYENNAKPGGQARAERLRLFDGVEHTRGDHRGESDDRIVYLRQAAELGDHRAMLAMGNGYYWGTFGLPRDFTRALRYYQRAHDAGALQGTVGVAKMTLKGEGGDRNLTKALEYYENAANRSSPDALNGLGYMYFYGDNVPKNETTALSYFRRAADLGNGDGSVNAGLMLRAGLGAERNVTAAHEHFERCARMNHVSCMYQAGIIEASGETGANRECAKAAGRFRAVAESGAWTAPLAEGLKAHLAGDTATARWMYDKGADMGVPAARFNAAWLHDARARDARVALEKRRRRGGDEDDDEEDAVRDSDGRSTTRRLAASGAASASALSRRAAEMCVDPATPPTDAAWASLARGDCEYYGASRLGGCARRRPREALRHYVAAARHARAALAAGYADDAADAVARAKYSEAWMRRRGEGCERDDARARAALIEAATVGSWRSVMAVAPPLAALLVADAANAVARALAKPLGRIARARSRSRSDSAPDSSTSVSSMSTSTWNALDALGDYVDGAGDRVYRFFVALEGSADARAVATAAYAAATYLLGFVLGWTFFVQPAMRAATGAGLVFREGRLVRPRGADVAEAMHARIARMRAETREEPREEPRDETETETREETETGREGEERGDAGRPREGERAWAEGEAIVRAPEGSPPTEPSDEEEPGDEFETID